MQRPSGAAVASVLSLRQRRRSSLPAAAAFSPPGGVCHRNAWPALQVDIEALRQHNANAGMGTGGKKVLLAKKKMGLLVGFMMELCKSVGGKPASKQQGSMEMDK